MSRRAPPLQFDGHREVDRAIWSVCAGKSAEIPTVGARVYYFPEGHLEQSSSPTPLNNLSDLSLSKPHVCCQITAVEFLAHSVTDEVFAKVSLQPLLDGTGGVPEGSRTNGDVGDVAGAVVTFAKVLTPSDANNGGGFSVPKSCADLIFPLLDFEADPPVQNLGITDVHGGVWKFRHIYRGTPRRHLLTTGWSKFVNGKKLVAGDSVLFMRKGDRTNCELHVGIRRGTRHDDEAAKKWTYDFSKIYGVDMDDHDDSNEGSEKSKVDEVDGAWSTGNGRISSEEIVTAIESAAQGKAFEVMYYPKLGMPDFVVEAEKVENALNVRWHPGIRVKIAMETEDASRMTWFHGTTSTPVHLDKGPWPGSPWRGLQVLWDDTEALQHLNRVNPWQVEFSCPPPSFQPDFPPTKRIKATPPSDPALLTDGTGQLLPLMLTEPNAAVQFSPSSLLDVNYFPAGMQGARHNSVHFSSLSKFINEDNNGICSDVSYLDKGKSLFITGTNTGSSQTEYSSSPESHSTVLSLGNGDNPESSSSPKVGISSFQLFGKTIYANDSPESGFSKSAGCIDDDANNGYTETRGVNGLLDLSLTDTCMNLLDKVDARCQGLSSADARKLQV